MQGGYVSPNAGHAIVDGGASVCMMCCCCLQGGKEVVEQVVGYKKKPLEQAVQHLAAA